MQRMHYGEGDVIFKTGDPSIHCFEIASGSVEIRLRQDDRVVGTFGPGEIFGEMSLIDPGPRSASAVAVADTVCVAYSAGELMELLESDPKEAMEYVRALIRRLRATNAKLQDSPCT